MGNKAKMHLDSLNSLSHELFVAVGLDEEPSSLDSASNLVATHMTQY